VPSSSRPGTTRSPAFWPVSSRRSRRWTRHRRSRSRRSRLRAS